jgi:hypothetical protein
VRCWGGILARPARGRNEVEFVWKDLRVSRGDGVATLGLCLARFLCRFTVTDNLDAILKIVTAWPQ